MSDKKQAGKKKGKKSKGETEEEKLAREAEEQKQRDLALKKQAEEVERKRLEELRIRDERRAFRERELGRFVIESAALLDKSTTREYQYVAEVSHETSQIEWTKYRDPTDEPNAFSEGDMNTFVTLTKETDVADLSEAIEAVKRIEKVSQAVEFVYSDRMANRDIAAQTRSYLYLNKFSELILEKLDSATIQLLRFVDNHINEKSEINIEEVAANVSVGMWASFSDSRPIRKSIQLEKMNVQLDIPKQILNQDTRFVHRVIRMPIDTVSNSAYLSTANMGQSAKYVIGDVLFVEILIPPPQAFSLRAKKWTIRDKSASSLVVRKSPYPTSVACRCYFKVPDDVILSDDVRVALWDDGQKEWTEEGITEFQYSEQNRMVQFYLASVGMIALVRQRTFDMPYKRWCLEAKRDVTLEAEEGAESTLYERQARLTVETKRFEVVIDIIGTSCRLVAPDIKQLADLLGKDMDPGILLLKLQRRGINLLPSPQDLKSIEGIVPKLDELEFEVLSQISRCASAYDFSSAPWSQQIPAYQAGVLVREATVYTGGIDTFDYECVLAEVDEHSEAFKNAPDVGATPPGSSGVKFTLVMGNEYGTREDKFSHVPRPNEVSHLELSEALSRRTAAETKERVERCNARFQNTVFILLRMIRPLSLS